MLEYQSVIAGIPFMKSKPFQPQNIITTPNCSFKGTPAQYLLFLTISQWCPNPQEAMPDFMNQMAKKRKVKTDLVDNISKVL
jgi:hypothetical protein